MPSVYRTALGKHVDIDQIRLQNEETVAVGNMRVNARGDVLNHSGQINQHKDDIILRNKQNKTYNSVRDEPIAESSFEVKQTRSKPQTKDTTSELQATIEQLKKEIEEKNLLLQQSALGKTLREAIADEPQNHVEETPPEVLAPTKTEEAPARGGLAAAIQKNMELQAKKTKPKRI